MTPFEMMATWIKKNVPIFVKRESESIIEPYKEATTEELNSRLVMLSETLSKAVQEELSEKATNVQEMAEKGVQDEIERIRAYNEGQWQSLESQALLAKDKLEDVVTEAIDNIPTPEDGEDGKSLEVKALKDRIKVRQEGGEWQYTSPLKGEDGKSAYLLAREKGYKGSLTNWLKSLEGKDGKEGVDGEDGKSAYEVAKEQGFKGSKEDWLQSLVGDAPRHQWDGTKLRFENPDGSWGEWVSLKGKALTMIGGGGGGGKGGFDPSSLEDSSLPEWTEIIVKQGEEWVRINYNTFLDTLPLIQGSQGYAGEDEVYAGGDGVVTGGKRLANLQIATESVEVVDGTITLQEAPFGGAGGIHNFSTVRRIDEDGVRYDAVVTAISEKVFALDESYDWDGHNVLIQYSYTQSL